MNRRPRLSALRLPLMAVLLCLCASAAAQRTPIEQRMTPEQFKAAGLEKLSPDELASLNTWLERGDAQPVASESGETRPPAAERPRDSFAGASDQPVRSRLKGSVQQWAPGTVFELENGQRWRVLKGSMTLPEALQAPEIEVAPGLMGRWFLQVHEDAPRARVERIE
ncbi:hypothetical protein M2650_07635 [Luteimonas sp. SX5]|uniref:Secreted protein n=1 Tax=Luteimonas galliterrae TaxID=2940486 RepID=A0ABT0MHZ8_9GAMM|nr:hypothetical protein [Luteimonas galliterrae]MCL1634502.1 hypothetical protein [Luteimonas galliterrae]